MYDDHGTNLVVVVVGEGIEVASVIELSEASGWVAAGLFQIYPPIIDTIVTGMTQHAIKFFQAKM